MATLYYEGMLCILQARYIAGAAEYTVSTRECEVEMEGVSLPQWETDWTAAD